MIFLVGFSVVTSTFNMVSDFLLAFVLGSFFLNEDGSQRTGDSFIKTTLVHFYRQAPSQEKITTQSSKKCEKGPRSHSEMRSGPSGLQQATDGVVAHQPPHHRQGNQATCGGTTRGSRRSIEATERVPYTHLFRIGRTEQSRLKPLDRSSKELDQNALPASTATDTSSTDEPEEAEEEKPDGRKNSTGRRSKEWRCGARAFPLVTTAGREG
jgi:hypothetical protein